MFKGHWCCPRADREHCCTFSDPPGDDARTTTAETSNKPRDRGAKRPAGLLLAFQAGMEPDVLVHRVRAEFLEMPGLRLTLAQATRLWRLEPAVCQEIIDTLVDSRFLRWTAGGMVMRNDH